MHLFSNTRGSIIKGRYDAKCFTLDLTKNHLLLILINKLLPSRLNALVIAPRVKCL